MVQIVRERPGLGAILGSSLGQGLSDAFNMVAQQKLQRLQNRNFVNALQQNGIPSNIAQIFPSLNPQIQSAILQRFRPSDIERTDTTPLENTLLGLIYEGTSQQSQENIPASNSPQINTMEQIARGLMTSQPGAQQTQQPLSQRLNTQQRPPSIGEILSRPSPGEERLERRHKETLGQAERIAREKSERPYIEKTLDVAKAKKEENNILKRIITVREHGKDIRPGLQSFLGKIGLDYDALKSGNELELSKLGSWFLRGGPAMFGGKVSNFEAQNLLRQVPNLLQTQEGSTRLANQMLNVNQAAIKEAEIAKRILKENNNVPPAFMRTLVEEEMEPYYQKYAEDFIKGVTAFTTKSDTIDELTPENAAQYKDAEVEDEKTGNKYVSDGTKWKRIP